MTASNTQAKQATNPAFPEWNLKASAPRILSLVPFGLKPEAGGLFRALPNIEKDIHGAAAYHSFLTGLVGSQRKMMQGREAGTHCFARFGPDFRFDTAAPDSPRGLAILEEKHFGPASLRS